MSRVTLPFEPKSTEEVFAPDDVIEAPPRRLRLRHVLFICMILFGVLPLAVSAFVLIRQNRSLLIGQEREHLVDAAEAVSQQVDSYLVNLREDLTLLGRGILVAPGNAAVEDRLAQSWVRELVADTAARPEVVSLVLASPAALDSSLTIGETREPPTVNEAEALAVTVGAATESGLPAYALVQNQPSAEPRSALAVPLVGPGGEVELVMASVNRLNLIDPVFESQGGEVAILLADDRGRVLWSYGAWNGASTAVEESGLLQGPQGAANFTRRFETMVDGELREVQATVSRVKETGWEVVALQPTTPAFALVNRMIRSTILSSLLLIGLALLCAIAVAGWITQPLHRLTESSNRVAAGDFSQRVEATGLTYEMADLAQNFNRMSDQVEDYIERLRQAAVANRDLFIGSIRAFAAAIDAKDPYTRGHSERVAELSKIISEALGFDEEEQQKVWLGALLHDVGKIGVDDRVLKKRGLLTSEEFDQMKAHTVIGAEIMARIGQLKEVVPAIRWHHENWNGKGYPDGLAGEQIPVHARIVGVADTFDAITTSRPYQQAYTLDFAVETITRLTGTRFDAKVVAAFMKAVKAGKIAEAVRNKQIPHEEVESGLVAVP